MSLYIVISSWNHIDEPCKGHESSCYREETQRPKRRSWGSSQAQLNVPSHVKLLDLGHLDLSVLSIKVFENTMYKDGTRKFILKQSRGVLPARD